MGFVALCFAVLVGILIASFLTNILKSIAVVGSILGILYYFTLASVEDKMKLDSFAMNLSVMKGDYLHNLMSDVKGSYSEALQDSETVFKEAERLKSETENINEENN